MSVVVDADRAGPYEVLETAYVGDLSVVYRCRDDVVPRQLGVKAVRRDSAHFELARRYALREARLRALVTHPNLLPLYGLLQRESDPLLVGPWLAGGSLRDLPPRALPVTRLGALATGLCAALDALHVAGWCHGDVSPGNILFTAPARGDQPFHPVLADLGTARRIGSNARRRGSVVVTPHVTAPEVWEGRPVDGRADLYSVGAIVYHELTGAWPFDAVDANEFAELHGRASVPAPSERSPHAGPALDRVLLRALAKLPDERYPTGAALATALQEAIDADGPREDDGRSPRRDERSPADGNGAAVAAAGERLEAFAATLDGQDQAALHVLLQRAAAAGAHASQETELLAMRVFAPVAALLALEDCGAAAALAAGNGSPAEVAAVCSVPERSLFRLMELLEAVGLLARDGDRYRLPPGPAAVYQAHVRAGVRGHPLRDASTFWSQLSRWVATGEAQTSIDRPDGAVYAGLAPGAGLITAPAARELATALVSRGLVPDRAEVLDLGAGSGVWSLAIAAAASRVRVTAVDRPAVLAQTRLAADAAGLTAERFNPVAGDWRDVPLPSSAFEIAVVANVCRLEPPREVSRLLGRVHDALRPGGVAVVVDTMPDHREGDLGALLQDLHLALRTPAGGVHDRASYVTWLEEVGLILIEPIVLSRTEGALTALVVRRR
jgi:SAM-dependent methyltransferase